MCKLHLSLLYFSATVLYDYTAKNADEHTLKVGDVLTNIKQIEDGWCEGVLKGKTAAFPDNFVKVCIIFLVDAFLFA